MGLFVKKSCIALTWSPDGKCWGTHVRRSGDRCKVSLFWRGEPGTNDSLASRLSEGFNCLGAHEHTVVVCGGMGAAGGFADVDVPRLSGDDMRNALTFELSKYAPVTADKIVWGYRQLPDGASGKSRARLIFLRESQWGAWVDAVSGLGQGVDLIIPPMVVADPLLADQDICLPDGRPGRSFLLCPSKDGGRTVQKSEQTAEGVFGALPAPLDLPCLDPGGLGAMSAEEQQQFAPALLLALYGLTRAADSDAKTWVPVPYELRPHRHRYSRLVASALVVYLLVLAGLMLGREYLAANAYYTQLKEECARLQRKIDRNAAREDNSEFMELLSKEMSDAYTERPSVTATLVELTNLIDKDAWVRNFAWNDGKIDLEISTSNEEFDIIQQLEESPLLGDVVPGPKQFGHDNTLTVRYQMNARYDIEGETSAPLAASKPVKAVPSPPEDEGDDEDDREEGDVEESPQETADPTETEEPPPSVEKKVDTEPTLVVPPPPPPPPPPGMGN